MRRCLRHDQCRRRLPRDRPGAGDVQEKGRGEAMTTELAINLTYILAALFFVIGLKMLSRPGTARRGNLVSAIGMLAAIVVTLLDRKIADYHWIIGGLAVGTAIGVISARIVKMTQMPGMVG